MTRKLVIRLKNGTLIEIVIPDDVTHMSYVEV